MGGMATGLATPQTSAPAETTIQVTYENNAVDGKASRDDKSDLTPDHLQD